MKQGWVVVSNLFFMMFVSTVLNASSSSNYFDSAYIGGNIGAAWNTSHYTTKPNCPNSTFSVFCTEGSDSANNGPVVAASGTGKLSDSIFTGGVQIGHNFQKNGIVIGGEADFESLDFHKQSQETGRFPTAFLGNQYSLNQLVSTNWLSTTRGRIGFTTHPSLLFFVTAGAAFTNLKIASSYSDNAIGFGFPGGTGSNSQTKNQVGWTLGGGGEWYMGHHLSVKIEYLYADFGSTTINIPLSNTPAYTQLMQFKVGLNTNLARLGVSYQFM